MDTIIIHHPARTMDELADALVTLTEHVVNKSPDREVNGFLGGRFGYGANWSSAAFDMRPYNWDECDCGQAQARDARAPHYVKKGLRTRARIRRYMREWEALERDLPCKPTCCRVLPNFRHHASGLEVRWYKYIGRGMETTGCDTPDVAAILAECIADVAAPPFKPWTPPPITEEMMDRWLKECDELLAASEDLAEADDGGPWADDDIPF
ncbi:hypothetical protein [Reyranella sp.]|uniref:hypothetical protein n=1 Tax=Reyranella sp. TaxID=1929291 RepID=UPI0012286410|nr:hypothetical protein [Reyranella sp.]TAJ89753.1 MAG: hypothetical protein EPO50_05140 [Reyranella sp.]